MELDSSGQLDLGSQSPTSRDEMEACFGPMEFKSRLVVRGQVKIMHKVLVGFDVYLKNKRLQCVH